LLKRFTTSLIMGVEKYGNPDDFAPPREDERALNLTVDWTADEEKKAKRKLVT
jgi:hypothetical protein